MAASVATEMGAADIVGSGVERVGGESLAETRERGRLDPSGSGD
jgi:hypothetical protein